MTAGSSKDSNPKAFEKPALPECSLLLDCSFTELLELVPGRLPDTDSAKELEYQDGNREKKKKRKKMNSVKWLMMYVDEDVDAGDEVEDDMSTVFGADVDCGGGAK
ncbi:hypothetical protein HHX47_DHR1000173 [Lentinula edodes]|nr:hypothetical protein HHX47_DHR1000173 [Lentinula edodes]